MLRLALLFLIIALVAAVLGFGGIARRARVDREDPLRCLLILFRGVSGHGTKVTGAATHSNAESLWNHLPFSTTHPWALTECARSPGAWHSIASPISNVPFVGPKGPTVGCLLTFRPRH